MRVAGIIVFSFFMQTIALCQTVNPVVMVKGKVVNERDMQPLEALIIYESLPDGNEEGFARTNPADGSFQIILKDGKKYSCYAVAEGYYSVSQGYAIFDLTRYKEIEDQYFYLAPVKQDQVIVLKTIEFKEKSDEILPGSIPELNRIVSFLEENKKITVEIGGHCFLMKDSDLNMDLSGKRAQAVMTYLIYNGVKSKQLVSKAFGDTRPLTFNKTDEDKKKNERIEMVILED